MTKILTFGLVRIYFCSNNTRTHNLVPIRSPELKRFMEHSEVILTGLVFLFVFGVTTQWIAWYIKVPAILLLLAVGSIAGSFLHIVEPDKIFGELLLPIVSISVGLILFEGGLNLRFVELKQTWRSLVGLLSVGVLFTWIMVSIAAHYILGLPWAVAVLLGSVLVVTGPTVIGPLLRDIRPSGKVSAIAKWEGIAIDPLGATLAVLTFNAIAPLSDGAIDSVILSMIAGLGKTLVVGTVCGVVPAVILFLLMRRFLLPDYLQNPMTLMLVLGSFAAGNRLEPEAGLLAVTVMGIALANMRGIDVSKIIEFKESIATLLISTLFIILSARVPLESLTALGWRGPAFAGVLILVVRPVAVFLSTIGSGLSIPERAFLGWFAPRGIVAAAVVSVFALRLGERGTGMVPATFWVIFTTVAVYGLTAPIVARRLGLAVADAQGLLVAGANKTVREIAIILKQEGFSVTMIDTQFPRIRKAAQADLNACFANVLSEEVLDLVDFGGIGKFLAMTANDQVNTLAAVRFRELFGRSNIFQLKSNEVRPSYLETRWQDHMAGRPLFAEELTHEKLNALIEQGAKFYVVPSERYIDKPVDRASERAKTAEKLQANSLDSPNTISNNTASVSPATETDNPSSLDDNSETIDEDAAIQGPLQAIASVVSDLADSVDSAPEKKPKPKKVDAWPLFVIDGKRLTVCTADTRHTYRPGQKVVVLSLEEIVEKPLV